MDQTTKSGDGGGRLPSDRRLWEEERYRRLQTRLQAGKAIAPKELAELLGCAWSEQGVGLVPALLQSGLITSAEVQQAKERKRLKPDLSLNQALQELGVLGEESLAMGMALTAGMFYLPFQPDGVDAAAIRHFDGVNAERWEALPYCFEGERLRLAVTDPRGVEPAEATRLTGRPTDFALAPRGLVMAAIRHWYGKREPSAETTLGDLDLRDALPAVEPAEAADRLTLVQLLNWVVSRAIRLRASDIHLIPEERFLHVNLRIDGRLHLMARWTAGVAQPLVSRIKVLCGMDIAERRLPQDGSFRVRLPDRLLDVRVSSIPAVLGETVVMRLLDHEQGLVQLDRLGFFPEDQGRLEQLVTRPYGLILLTGPTGSGKSTTLRSLLEFILRERRLHVLSVEDPVEVKVPGVVQVQVNTRIDFTFARALRHFLRHDPDVILVGEVRDAETARITVQAALTGHLVLSTLHTNDAPGAITRLLDMGVESYLAASAVTLVIAQRLVRLLCQSCRTTSLATDDELVRLRAMGHEGVPTLLHRPGGCRECSNTGFRGRTVVYEMLVLDETLRGGITRRESASVLCRLAMAHGFRPLMVNGLRKVLSGWTSLDEMAVYLDTLPTV